MSLLISQGEKGSPGAYGATGDPGIKGIKGDFEILHMPCERYGHCRCTMGMVHSADKTHGGCEMIIIPYYLIIRCHLLFFAC